MFLIETLGWKEGIGEMGDATSDADPTDVTKLVKYLFLTEQMERRKGLTLFGERGKKAVEKGLQQIHSMEGFQPNHWYEITKKKEQRRLNMSCI